MKTLKNHVLIYDDECPLCMLYTGWFIRLNMLDKEGRLEYGNLMKLSSTSLDEERARNEIALVDTTSDRITYGVDSLVKILGHSFPFILWCYKWSVVNWLLKKLYALISYNRKVIIPGSLMCDAKSCTPTFNWKYRLLYILIAWLTTALILSHFAELITGIVPAGGLGREFWICGGQMVFQGILVGKVNKQVLWDYLGHLMTISLAGALSLIPLLVIGYWGMNEYILTGVFLLVAGGMLMAHIKRVDHLGLPKWVSVGWVVYRALILLFFLI